MTKSLNFIWNYILSRASASKKSLEISSYFCGLLRPTWFILSKFKQEGGFFFKNFLRWSILFQLEFFLAFSERYEKNWDEEPKISVELPVFEVVRALKIERMKNSKLLWSRELPVLEDPMIFFYCFSSILITLLALFHNTYILLFFICHLYVLFRYI